MIVDSREPPLVQAAVDAAVATIPGVTRFTTLLETGDFLIRDGCTPAPCLVGIERKKVSDLLGSFRSGRLDKQLTRLKAQYRFPILLVEGEIRMDQKTRTVTTGRGHKTHWSHASVQMFLWSLQRRAGICVLTTHGIPETADLVRVLARRAAEGCVAHLEIVDTPKLQKAR